MRALTCFSVRIIVFQSFEAPCRGAGWRNVCINTFPAEPGNSEFVRNRYIRINLVILNYYWVAVTPNDIARISVIPGSKHGRNCVFGEYFRFAQVWVSPSYVGRVCVYTHTCLRGSGNDELGQHVILLMLLSGGNLVRRKRFSTKIHAK